MLTTYFFTFLSILGANNLYAQTIPTYVPSNGLVAWYSFTGNAIDSSGNGRNGTVTNAVLTTDRFGNTNSAYYFNGTNAGIQSNNFPTNYTAYTFSGWLKSDMISYTDCDFFGQTGTVIAGENSSFGFSSAGSNFNARHRRKAGSLAITANVPMTNNWLLATTTWDGIFVKVYIDGLIVDSLALDNRSDLQSRFTIGYGMASSIVGYYFKGKIDDIGVWNRALTPREVATLYTGKNIASTNTVAILSDIEEKQRKYAEEKEEKIRLQEEENRRNIAWKESQRRYDEVKRSSDELQTKEKIRLQEEAKNHVIGSNAYGGTIVTITNGHGFVVRKSIYGDENQCNVKQILMNKGNYEGFHNWRFPTMNELSIIYINIIKTKLSDIPYGVYWSSEWESGPMGEQYVRTMDFNDGKKGRQSSYETCSSILVHDF